MKRLISCICIMAAIIIISVIALINLRINADKFTKKVQFVMNEYENENYDNAVKLAGEITDEWKEYAEYSLFINDKDNMSQITHSAVKIAAFAAIRSDEIIAECEYVISMIDILYHSQLPVINNVL